MSCASRRGTPGLPRPSQGPSYKPALGCLGNKFFVSATRKPMNLHHSFPDPVITVPFISPEGVSPSCALALAFPEAPPSGSPFPAFGSGLWPVHSASRAPAARARRLASTPGLDWPLQVSPGWFFLLVSPEGARVPLAARVRRISGVLRGGGEAWDWTAKRQATPRPKAHLRVRAARGPGSHAPWAA